MNKPLFVLSMMLGALTGSGVLAGPLTPPAGAIGASMKTLTEVEPRTAISVVNTPGDGDSVFKITSPGSYYLTANVQGVASKHGIEVTASNVTIDLNGFALVGGAGSFSGVLVNVSNRSGVEVKNGSVSGWGGYGVSLAEGSRVENVRVSGNTQTGVWVGSHSQVTGCDSSNNGGYGIVMSSSSLVRSCTVSGNSGMGIDLGTGCVAEGCASASNGVNGFQVGNLCLVKGCNARANTGSGFECSDWSQLVECAASGNTLDGIKAAFGARITNCTAFTNTRHGISVESQCAVIGNLCRQNGAGAGQGAGVYMASGTSRSVIEGNTCLAGDFGVKIDGTGALVKGNTCSSNTVNYEVVAGSRVTAILTLPVSGAISGNAGGSSVSDPDANYAY